MVGLLDGLAIDGESGPSAVRDDVLDAVSYTHLMKGNILLRREQYRWADDEARWVGVAREMIGAKIANCRSLLLRCV